MPTLNDINKLNDAWIGAGNDYNELSDKLTNALLDDSIDEETVTNLKNDAEKAKNHRDALHEQLVSVRASNALEKSKADPNPLDNKETDLKDKFVSNFVNMMEGKSFQNVVTSGTDPATSSAAGLTIPQDIRTAINLLVRQYDSLQQYVKTETVATLTGSRVYEKWSDIQPLAQIEEGKTISDLDEPKLSVVKYLIKKYAGIITVTDDVLADTAENILSWLSTWVARKVVVTRNQAIIKLMQAMPNKKTITKFDDLKDLALTGVDPAIQATSIFITNQTGLAKLAEVKDALGHYLLQRDPTSPEVRMIEGKKISVVSDRWLPATTSEDGKTTTYPLFFGDASQAITLFDRQNMTLLSTNLAAGAFESDETKLRVIDRFDVQTTDTEALVYGSFSAIEDQPTTLKA